MEKNHLKEYRLVKCYPGSPELGIICEERNNKSSFCYYYEGEKNVGILKNEVENQPEYWEEVKEFTTLFFETDGTIKTIVRHSDMTYFSVGDWFYATPESSEPNIILELKYVLNGGFRVMGTNSCVPLSGIIATKDKAVQYELNGSMLYRWDKVWGVHPKSFKKNFVKYGREEDGVPVYDAYAQNNYIWFTSKERAEDYILMNNKYLSISDILSVSYLNINSVNRLKNLINERVQK